MNTFSVEHVTQSYGRCLAQPGFFDVFYQHFFASSPQIPAMFKYTDLGKQKELLKDGITLVVMYAKNEDSHLVREKLKFIGHRHSHGNLNVTTDLYGFWTDSLILTVREFDPKFTTELEEEWREIVAPAIGLLESLY